MKIDTSAIVTATEANQNFSRISKMAEKKGHIVVFKNNRPKLQCHSDKDDGKRTGTETGSGLFFLLRKLQKRVDRTGKMCGRFRY